ncbi:hypothetical protein QRX50_13605 [Amycolatopsis carbonis]|uniref:Uncharacterized protein n=1 Tax=Amycolatopsis carbonis TaxID=715471 RepID=A0A9Y2MUE2_9PSEU|nr:hypothetical protein [Amycolatopsis sp. 2-15]WIX81715.1 hypothetical protein QRX50_13605 [Amycolatopsis sp. 2-15]
MKRPEEDPGQFGLFGGVASAPPPASGRQCPPAKSRKPRGGHVGNPLVAKDVLAEVQEGRFALLDDTDRVVVFEDTNWVRVALDEDIVLHLLSIDYIRRGPARDTVTAYHGAVRRPVTPLKLTPRGRSMLQRWSNLAPLHT